jgi:hypothetical protein
MWRHQLKMKWRWRRQPKAAETGGEMALIENVKISLGEMTALRRKCRRGGVINISPAMPEESAEENGVTNNQCGINRRRKYWHQSWQRRAKLKTRLWPENWLAL